jgi:hypothetical protein
MTSITLPFWIFALSFGVPCFIFICLVGLLMRKIRHPKKNQFANISMQQLGNSQFHSDLLCSQIDTIFSGLNAILESERLKIQALLGHGNINLLDAQTASVEADSTMENTAPQPSKKDVPSFEQEFTMHSEADSRQVDATQSSGLSQTEIDLAMRMRSSRDVSHVRKLEAVA